MKAGLIHILGCFIPLALIFILPTFGISSEVTYTLFIVLMFACHLFMMGGHGNHNERVRKNSIDKDSANQEREKPCH